MAQTMALAQNIALAVAEKEGYRNKDSVLATTVDD